MPPQFPGKRQRNTHQRRMRQSLFDLEIGPAIIEPLESDRLGDIEGVTIGLIDLGEGFDQIGRVTFVAAELGPDGMRVDCDVQDRLRSSFCESTGGGRSVAG